MGVVPDGQRQNDPRADNCAMPVMSVASAKRRKRVGEAARRLVELRDGRLNPPGLDPADLAKRTLTNLHNQRPTWLANAHADLDAAVFAAYGSAVDLSETAILARLLTLNLSSAVDQTRRGRVSPP